MGFSNFYKDYIYDKSGTTSIDHGHSHTYSLDEYGNGRTSDTDGHTHEIVTWLVNPAGDGHIHTLQRRK